MCDSDVILQLYSHALYEHQIKYGVTDDEIRTAIQNMTEVYKPNPTSLSESIVYVANYNDAGHRCAYIHKYAPFHTALVADMLQRALDNNIKVFNDIIYPSGDINICSLGGGPGSDIFGVLSVLNATFDIFQVSATIIDCMENWNEMFCDLITQLRYGNYGYLGECVSEQYFDWKYLQHNLLSKMTNQVKQAIGRANLVTMIKFVSASSCKDTPAMIKAIFGAMRPGSLVLYIDNAGGGFHQMIRKEAQNCNFITVFGPLKHELYRNEDFNTKRFGYTPCLETKVTVQIWRKPSQNMNTHSELNDLSAVNPFPGVHDPRIIYDFPGPEPVSNQRTFHNRPNAASNFLYENEQRIFCSQPPYAQPPRAPVTNQNYNTRRTGSRRQFPKRSQPRRTAAQAGRNQRGNRIVEDEEEPENDDCGTCCVIS